MAVYLQAPWDLIQTTVMLPAPRLGNLEANAVDVNIRNSISGVIYSYVQTNARKTFAWDLYLRRGKALELQMFIETYNDIHWRVTDWDEKVYKAVLTNDVDFSQVGRDNFTQVRLEFEGERIDV